MTTEQRNEAGEEIFGTPPELVGASKPETTERAKPNARPSKDERIRLFHPNGFPVLINGERRADVLRKRGYTDAKPKEKKR